MTPLNIANIKVLPVLTIIFVSRQVTKFPWSIFISKEKINDVYITKLNKNKGSLDHKPSRKNKTFGWGLSVHGHEAHAKAQKCTFKVNYNLNIITFSR